MRGRFFFRKISTKPVSHLLKPGSGPEIRHEPFVSEFALKSGELVMGLLLRAAIAEPLPH